MLTAITSTSPVASGHDDVFLNSKQVRARYGGVSAMWLHRREHDGSNFPKCVVIAGRKMWRLSELETWERGLATKSDQANHLTNRKQKDKENAAASR